ncbi:NUDIX domain-containing protein [Verrucosispora sp. FIM060022]|uniref:NUDIX hydrolase n=1 Tax=Verrucosispora sp. FIM060022 TaxID=1479020 RepID=UPI000F870A8E|nr:NUDIX domain-containing protein [Verrucosispora sp. FIM060022]RUL93848.1 NUDIX hydrolase [Verrucosispora sp. FIM060022]
MTTDRGYPAPPALVEHARRFWTSGGQPPVPRVAATVLLLRPAREGYEAYLIRRVAAMAFGGMYAFPGGGVDPSDSTTGVDWAGPTPASWGETLALAPAAAQAVVCAAAREVFEEAGVLLAGPDGSRVVGDVSDDSWERARADLEQRRTGFAELLARRGLTLRSDLLLPWSRWVTPEFEPRRFDTYFFVALLPEGQRTRDVSGEADHTLWIRPADACARAGAGELSMLPPTLVTLGEVAACPDLDAVARAASARDAATPITPRLDLSDPDDPRFHLT